MIESDAFDLGRGLTKVRTLTKSGEQRLNGLPKTKTTAVLSPHAIDLFEDGTLSPRGLEDLAVEAGREACPVSDEGCNIEANFGKFPEELDELAVSCENGACLSGQINIPMCAVKALALHLNNIL